MKTRNTETPKSGTAKKTPTKKTPSKPSGASTEPAAPKAVTPTVAKQQKSGGTPKTLTRKTATPNTASKSSPKVEDGSASVETAQVTPEVKVVSAEKPAVEPAQVTPEVKVVSAEKPTVEPAQVTPEVKVVSGAKPTAKKSAVKKSAVKTKPSPKTVAVKTPKKAEAAAEKSLEEAPVVANVEETSKKEEPVVENVDESQKNKQVVIDVLESPKKEEPVAVNVVESSKEEGSEKIGKEEAEVEEGNGINMEEDAKEDGEGKQTLPEEVEHNTDERMEDEDSEQVDFEEPEGEEHGDDDGLGADEEAGRLEDHMEISALARERRIKKEQEIFVGGLDRDSVEDDIKKAFEKIGDVVEVRLHKNPQTNKNKGYAFVRFANKEQASRALNELKNPVIRGKRCGTAPSEDNDTLFVGNICNTWTKEAIKQKLKEYGLEGVENVTLVADAQHEGLSRGFAFVEFSCHADAMVAYKRLQKPDVIFGHAERTVKVAFAEPLREPDPEVMAQVKSVFVDGLPPYWDEERVKEHFQPYGEIERIVLARNMPTAKRKDFGFIDYNTHEAAIACIDGLNQTELGDEKSKTKVKVRLANPMPKTQAVKGGLCGGFRIGHAGSGFSRFGRGFGRGGRSFNRGNFQRGNFHTRGRGRAGRFAYAGEAAPEGPYSGTRGRRPFGGQGQKGYGGDRTGTSLRPDLGRSRYGATERGRGKSVQSRRQPFSSEGHFGRPVGGRHFVDDPYMYDDSGYGLKRPYSMLDHEPDYLEPSRLRPRFDYPDPVASSRETHYQDSYGAGSGLYSHDYYGSTYGSSAYSSMYGGDRAYGGGYYY